MPLPPEPRLVRQLPPAHLRFAASIGGICVLLALAAPLLWPGLILLSFPLVVVGFALALVSLRQKSFVAGIFLLLVSVLAAPVSWKMFTDRDRVLSADGREQILQELRTHR